MKTLLPTPILVLCLGFVLIGILAAHDLYARNVNTTASVPDNDCHKAIREMKMYCGQ